MSDRQEKYVDLGAGKGMMLASEVDADGFNCSNCGQWVTLSGALGTKNRNHCPFCLFSKHVDSAIPGDRLSNCRGIMKPIGLAFRKEGRDKFGNERKGEIMLVHECLECSEVSINRLAGDDDSAAVVGVFNLSKNVSIRKKEKLAGNIGIEMLSESNRRELLSGLCGSGS